jgi:hypothetical protein
MHYHLVRLVGDMSSMNASSASLPAAGAAATDTATQVQALVNKKVRCGELGCTHCTCQRKEHNQLVAICAMGILISSTSTLTAGTNALCSTKGGFIAL